MKHITYVSLFVVVGSILLASVPPASAQDNATTPQNAIKLKVITMCKNVEDRKPVDAGKEFTIDTGKVYCHTALSNSGEEQMIKHLWYQGEKLMLTIDLKVGKSSNWRTWSNKNLYEGYEGEWKVVVQDEQGEELGSQTFTIK